MEQHILIIDDNTKELRRLREILSREGYNIMTATDWNTAERICDTLSITFVLANTRQIKLKKIK
ncbi:MAG TPA: response regulator [Caldithrix abyssi]|uniref:Response regulator n=1 Tax=Caldithrix abyssi TaxID=187145 RepID=A0A7V1PVJ3_CALAY|nr:response regulator [Caldithrix abyssi]